MPDTRYPKQCYLYSKNQDSVERKILASCVRLLLNMYVFYMRGLVKILEMCHIFVIISAEIRRLWTTQHFSNITVLSRLIHYRLIESLFTVEYYVSNINSRKVRKYLCC